MDLKFRFAYLVRTFNFFWAASLLILLAWIEVAKADSHDAQTTVKDVANGAVLELLQRYSDQNFLDVLVKPGQDLDQLDSDMYAPGLA